MGGKRIPYFGKIDRLCARSGYYFPDFPEFEITGPRPKFGRICQHGRGTLPHGRETRRMSGKRYTWAENVVAITQNATDISTRWVVFRNSPNLGFWALPLNSGALANATGVHFLLTAKRFARPGKVTHCLGAFLRFRKARQTSRPEGLFVTRFAQIQAYGATLRSLGALAKMDGRHFHVAGKRFAWPENDTHGRKTVPPMLGSAADFATGVVIYFPDFTQFKLTGHYPEIWAHRPTWPGGHFHLVGKRPRVAGKRYTWAGNVCHISGNRQTSRHIWLFISPISPKFGRTDHHCRGGVSTWSGNAPHGR